MAQVAFLAVASSLAMFPWRKLPAWAGPLALAAIALAVRVAPIDAARSAGHDMANAIAFLLLAVPLAVLLDETGFFSTLASMFDRGRHLRSGLWLLAALVTIVFNLDAAVVLLTPLYVRIADRRRVDPIVLGFIPALLASLASSVLPVSNLTNLIATERLDLGASDFLVHLALPSIAAIAAGGLVFMYLTRGAASDAVSIVEPVDSAALWVGFPVVVWLLLGFTVGQRVGIPAWITVAIALLWLTIRGRTVPWRSVPYGAAFLAIGLGVLASSAAAHIDTGRLLAIPGVPGELATIGVFAFGANAVNNLPALLLALPGLDQHHERVWAVLLGVNIGPTLWITGALSTLLWQATLGRLGHAVSARDYARIAARVGIPALAAATLVHIALVVLSR